MSYARQIERLGYEDVAPFDPDTVDRIRVAAGVEIAPSVRSFFLEIGRSQSVTRVQGEVLNGTEVLLLDPKMILLMIEEYENMGLIPFAQDLWGNTFFVASGEVLPSGDFRPHLGPHKEANRVVFFDNDENRFVTLASSFEAFLVLLEPVKAGGS